MKRTVQTTDGKEWEIVRPNLPWRPRKRGDVVDFDIPGIGFLDDDPISTILIAVVWVLAIILLLPLLVLFGEVLILLALVPLWIFGRWLGVLRWRIDIRRGDETIHTLLVRGTLRSREIVDEFSTRISQSTDAELIGRFRAIEDGSQPA